MVTGPERSCPCPSLGPVSDLPVRGILAFHAVDLEAGLLISDEYRVRPIRPHIAVKHSEQFAATHPRASGRCLSAPGTHSTEANRLGL